MPIQTVSQLTKTVTRDEALQTLLELLQGFGFATSSWQTGSVQRSLVEMSAEVWSQVSGTIAFIARGGFNALASGEALTQFSDSSYDNQRIAAVATRGDMVLTESIGGGPYPIAIGERVVVDSASGQTYRNTTGGTLNPSSSLTLEWQAEVGGTNGNIDASLTTLSLQTTIAGVAVTNPPIGATGTWITALGVDQESDAALRNRNRAKWASMAQSRPEDGYIFLALSATTPSGTPVGITKAAVDATNPGGQFTVIVYIANDETTATAGQVADVEIFLQARRSISTIGGVLPGNEITAPAVTVPLTITGTVYHKAGSDQSVVGAAVQAAVKARIVGLQLGGEMFQPFTTGLALTELVAEISNVDNVLSVVLTNPTANIPLSFNQLLVLAQDVWNAAGTGSLNFVEL